MFQGLSRVLRPLRRPYVILVVLVSWVFFRADTLSASVAFLRAMAGAAHPTQTVPGVAMFVDNEVVAGGVAGDRGRDPDRSDPRAVVNRRPAPPLSTGACKRLGSSASWPYSPTRSCWSRQDPTAPSSIFGFDHDLRCRVHRSLSRSASRRSTRPSARGLRRRPGPGC